MEIARGMSGVPASPPIALPAGVQIAIVVLLLLVGYAEVYSQGDEKALREES